MSYKATKPGLGTALYVSLHYLVKYERLKKRSNTGLLPMFIKLTRMCTYLH